MRKSNIEFASMLLAGAAASAMVFSTQAQEVKLILGMPGWTDFAPLILADKAGLFKKYGLDGDQKMIPQKGRHLALASKAILCAATPVKRHVASNTNSVPIVQIFQMDKSFGANGIVARGYINNNFADFKSKTIGVDAPGTAPFFCQAWMLSKNGMSTKDVKLATLAPQPAAQSFVTGQNDAAMNYEPYLSTVRANPKARKILATTLDYPMIMDTVNGAPEWLKANPKAAQSLANAYFDALEMIKSSAFLRWQDKVPTDFSAMFYTSFIK